MADKPKQLISDIFEKPDGDSGLLDQIMLIDVMKKELPDNQKKGEDDSTVSTFNQNS